MKKNIINLILISSFSFLCSCNDEWKDEIYRNDIGLKAPINSEGVTDVHLRYEENGETTYQLPVIVGGSLVNKADLNVQISVDKDTLKSLNEERWKLREDLYYKELPENNYDLKDGICRISAGNSVGLFDIKFKFSELDLRYQWVLPLTIIDKPDYNPNPIKNYRKALLRINPFNDYSGTYSATSMNVFIGDNSSPMVVTSRKMFVVSKNKCFFYAGVTSEELLDREKYKVFVTFNEDGTLIVEPSDPENKMKFKLLDGSNPTYRISEEKDAVYPNILHKYITISMNYEYYDVSTYEDYPIYYRAEGTMTMERRYDTLIPDQDQAILW